MGGEIAMVLRGGVVRDGAEWWRILKALGGFAGAVLELGQSGGF